MKYLPAQVSWFTLVFLAYFSNLAYLSILVYFSYLPSSSILVYFWIIYEVPTRAKRLTADHIINLINQYHFAISLRFFY